MASPFKGYRDRIRALCPGFLQEGVDERLMYVFGLELDAVQERLLQGIRARFPVVRNRASGVVTPGETDALAIIGADRVIERGFTESNLSYGTRLQRAFSSWQIAGSARAMLGQVLGFLLSSQPRARTVSSRYEPDPARVEWMLARGLIASDPGATYPPALVSTQWHTYEAGADQRAEPVRVYALAGAAGEWDWDSLSQVSGSWSWWGCFVVLSPRDAAVAWTSAGPKWGSTPARKWGSGLAWGVTTSANVGRSIQAIVKKWKAQHAWVRYIIVSFDDALFDPAQLAGGGVNPDGLFGRWGKSVNGQRVRARFSNARYGSGVV